MRNAESIAAINHEQLVTATDWLLARGGKWRDSAPVIAAPVRGSYPVIAAARAELGVHEAPTVPSAHPYLVPRRRLAAGSQPGILLPRRAHATLTHSQLARRSSAELYVGAALVAHAHVGSAKQHLTPAHLARVLQHGDRARVPNIPSVAPYISAPVAVRSAGSAQLASAAAPSTAPRLALPLIASSVVPRAASNALRAAKGARPAASSRSTSRADAPFAAPRSTARAAAAPVLVARVLPGTPAARAQVPSLAQSVTAHPAPRTSPKHLAPLSVPAHLAPAAVLAHLEAAPSAHDYVGRAPVARSTSRRTPAPRSTQSYRSPEPSARTREAAEQTLFVRAVRPRTFPVTIVLTMLVGILAGLVAML